MRDDDAFDATLTDEALPPVAQVVSAAAVGCGGDDGDDGGGGGGGGGVDVRGLFGCRKSVTLTSGCRSFGAGRAGILSRRRTRRSSSGRSDDQLSRPKSVRPDPRHLWFKNGTPCRAPAWDGGYPQEPLSAAFYEETPSIRRQDDSSAGVARGPPRPMWSLRQWVLGLKRGAIRKRETLTTRAPGGAVRRKDPLARDLRDRIHAGPGLARYQRAR